MSLGNTLEKLKGFQKRTQEQDWRLVDRENEGDTRIIDTWSKTKETKETVENDIVRCGSFGK